MKSQIKFEEKSFAIYGLGKTGNSVINYFKRFGFENYIIWDDNKNLKKKWELTKNKETRFKTLLNFVDFIIVSPGINIKKSKLKKILLKNKSRIITDLDLFYIQNPKLKSVVVTGSNGKSTTCKILDHVFNKNKVPTVLGGNIGKPILDVSLKKNPWVIIEASSFQLAYSKFVKPSYALLINISKDHIEWHGSFLKYINSKLKIFEKQKTNDLALFNSKKILKIYKKRKYLGNIHFVKNNNYKKIEKYFKNNSFNFNMNKENLSYVISLSKIFKIKEKGLIDSLNSFKGLPHRHEIFLKKNNKTFINDSKATSFSACEIALKNNDNIYWILGGMPKERDKFNITKFKNKIIKSYIIGKYMKKFEKHLKNKVEINFSKTLNSAVISILKDIQNDNKTKFTIILSPASASYDQFKNFEERGNKFKKLVKIYARKLL
tara:strand:- start:93 stop:1394 length:1302 start_codon:yes stop_codon:yes gene_type:complete